MYITPKAIGVFFGLAKVTTAAAAVTLLSPGTAVDAIWDFKREQFVQMLSIAGPGGAGFAVFSAVLATTAFGTATRKRWGFGVALAIFVLNAISDAARFLSGGSCEGGPGVAVSALIL